MTLNRLELDGLGSPTEIAARIHQIEGDLRPRFSIEDMCRKLDIVGIEEITTNAFEAALIMDPDKAAGSILLASGRSPRRRRFSIGHELGHFLIPTHLPRPGEPFECSLADLHLVDNRERDRRKRTEAEANRFAASLLMPPTRIRTSIASPQPDLGEIVRLAIGFGVSKEAMSRAYVEAVRDAVAVIILHDGRMQRVYRQRDFPWIVPRFGQPVPTDSIASGHRLQPGELSDSDECDPEVWFDDRNAARVEVLTEQLLGQREGFAMLLLYAEMVDD